MDKKTGDPAADGKSVSGAQLKENEFHTAELLPGKALRLRVDGQNVAVYNCEGSFFATQEACTHRNGPLEQGKLTGCVVECPLHSSQFDARTGAVIRGPASRPLKTHRVVVEGDHARVEQAAEPH